MTDVVSLDGVDIVRINLKKVVAYEIEVILALTPEQQAQLTADVPKAYTDEDVRVELAWWLADDMPHPQFEWGSDDWEHTADVENISREKYSEEDIRKMLVGKTCAKTDAVDAVIRRMKGSFVRDRKEDV